MKKERKPEQFIKKPIYRGGPKALREFVSKNLKYPDEARKANIQGSVNLKYTIDYRGEVVDTKVIAGLGYGCDEEAIRVVKLLKFDVPKNHARHILFHKKITVHFRAKKQDVPAVAKTEPAKGQKLGNIQYKIVATTKKKTKEKTGSSNSYTYTIKW